MIAANFILNQIVRINSRTNHHSKRKALNAAFVTCFSGGAAVALTSIGIDSDGSFMISTNDNSCCKCEQKHMGGRNDTTSAADDNGVNGNAKMFYNYFPKSQLFQPKRPYPAWDDNWDGKEEEYQQQKAEKKGSSKAGTTRHLILIRHGQYDETFEDDVKRKLTKLGREQAHLTGKRLEEMINGINDKFQPCNVNVIRVSDMTRAKETASIISEYLPKDIVREKPDPLLNEGIPAQIIPKRAELNIDEDLAKDGARIEKAFTKYFYRKVAPQNEGTLKSWFFTGTKSNDKELDKADQENHEFDIIVCHGNVIRYMFCRALQLPPEAWLRLSIFNCSLTYLMIMPNGRVSCRMLGDIGHLGYDHSTFSMNHGFPW